jgi:dUTPase
MSIEKIKFLKSRDVKNPSRAHNLDAGIDFYVPNFDSKFIKDLKIKNSNLFEEQNYICSGSITISSNFSCDCTINKDEDKSKIKFDDKEGKNYITLLPSERILIPSGINCQMSKEGRALIAANKSGIASKLGLIVGASIVDYSYQGEIHINVINTSNKPVKIYEEMKLVQFLETPIFTSNIEVSEDIDNFYDKKTDRSDNGFGSTDKK